METSANDDSHASHDGDHPRFLAHHFQTPQQQFDAGKLGMWIFLVTEILLFGGLFCAYAVFRSNHPEIFQYAAEEFLDKTLGAVNTAVLIFSSLTMAWAVRCAQLNQRTLLITLLSITIGCGFVFLGVKYVEYKHKWEEGLLWASQFAPVEHGHASNEHEPAAAAATPAQTPPGELPAANGASPESSTPVEEHGTAVDKQAEDHGEEQSGATEEKAAEKHEDVSGAGQPVSEAEASDHVRVDQVNEIVVAGEDDAHGHQFRTEPKNVGVFFSIYFAMTGLHGLHVIAGMGAICWILVRSVKGHFNDQYFGPVDYVGLYWHLVDLIWIYLFPLLYLIH